MDNPYGFLMEGVMKIEVNSSQGKYDIILKRGILKELGKFCNLNRKVMVITDSGVPEEYLKTVLSQCKDGYSMVVKQGEQSKSFETYESCLRELLKNNFSRKDLLIALGGGVVGDLAGFVASTYMRGIDFINLPTTTLAQIDSSIGGKVAINVDGIKNCVGTFYQPKLVLIDFDVLKTLHKRHYNEGLAEAIKAGLIKDKALFELFEKEDLDIEKIICLSLAVKKYYVEKDEKELHERKILNFGHTFGHAYESYGKLKDYLHGECVAMGMMRILEDEEIRERLKKILIKLEIPYTNAYDEEEVLKYVFKDKKTYGSKISVIKVNKIGQAFIEEAEINDLRR